MMRLFLGKKRLIALGLLTALGGFLWYQRTALVAWHYVNQLASADESNREVWVERVVALDEAAVPRILACLESATLQSSENLEHAFVEIARGWKPDQPRSRALVAEIKGRFAKFTQAGKTSALRATSAILAGCGDGSASAPLLRDAGD